MSNPSYFSQIITTIAEQAQLFSSPMLDSFKSWVSSHSSSVYSVGGIAGIVALLFGSLALISKYYMPILEALRLNTKTNSEDAAVPSVKNPDEIFQPKPKESLENLDMHLFWYPVAFSEDIKVTDLKPYTIKLLGEPLVLYRTEDGKVTCAVDLCPHRSAKLSTGVVNNYNGKRSLECAYHGWRFGKQGQCERIPSVASERMEGLCKTIKAETRTTHEFAGMVWVWPNKKVKADINLIPKELFREEFMEGSNAPYTMLQKQRDIPCHYSLVLENLLDFAHLDFSKLNGLICRANCSHSSRWNFGKQSQVLSC